MKKINKKTMIILVLSLVALLSIPAGVYALLTTSSNEETNKFAGGYVNTAVIENEKEHENSTNNSEDYKTLRKENDHVEKIVSIKNIATGDNATAMYARVRLIPTIVSDSDSKTVLGGNIKITYQFEEGTAWKVKDETYYYTKPIEPNTESEKLLTGVTILQDIPEGYHLELKVLADSIVTRPQSLLTDTWGINENFSDLSSL